MTHFSVNNSFSFNNPSQTVLSNAVPTKTNLSPELQSALNAIQGLGLRVELCGSWMWIFGTDASHEPQLRQAGFKWSSRQGCWYLPPQLKSVKTKDNASHSDCQPWSMNQVRKVFGSRVVQF